MEANTTPATPLKGYLRAARLVLALAVVAGLVFLVRSVSVEGSLGWLSEEIDSLGVWGPAAFGGLFVAATVCLLPSTPITLAAGAVLGLVVGAVTVWIASLASATISFFLSRYVAHDWVARSICPRSRLGALWRALGDDEGWKVVAAVRLSHLFPFGLQNLIFGVSPIRFVPFILATAVSMLPGTILYAYLGYLGAEALGADPGRPPGVLGWAVRIGGLLVMVVAVIFIARFARRVLSSRTGQTEEELAETADVTAGR
jgi:uncharacterized membrane protein YdjX (TVP38/TMEM64 family)